MLKIIGSALGQTVRGLLGLVILLVGAFCSGVLYYSNLPWPWMRTALAAAFGLWTLAAFGSLGGRVRPLLWYAAGLVLVLTWWNLIPAEYAGEYPDEVAVLNTADFDGDFVTVHGIRNFDYRTPSDYDVRRYDKTFDLRKVKTVDFIVSHWDEMQAVAHTFLTFVFDDGKGGEDYLCCSVEIRRRKDQEYSTLKGIFRQYTLIYVWGDERDLIRLRTNFRGEDVYLYPTISDPAGARRLLDSMLRRTNELARKPRFYNTIGQNCTTTIVDHVNEVVPGAIPYSKAVLMNGFSDKYAYDLGWIKTNKGFMETRAECLINASARAAGNAPDFSTRIRKHILPR